MLVSLGNDTRHAVQQAIDGKTSVWPTAMPIACHHFDLSPVEFRDALSLRYHLYQLKVALDLICCTKYMYTWTA